MLNKSIYESGNGGAIFIKNKAIQHTNTLNTQAYLLMFGGNKEASTKKDYSTNELRMDWWGNDINKNPSDWINSETERVLTGITINSQSTTKITNAIKKDLRKLEAFGEVDIQVIYPNRNTVKITITLTEKTNKTTSNLILVWDSTKNEVIEVW